MGREIAVAPIETEVTKVGTGVMDGGKVLGTVLITVFEDKPVKCEFTGGIKGREMGLILHAIEKGYNTWKHNQMRKGV